METIYILPIILAFVSVFVVYVSKKGETDETKIPNYPVVFIVTLLISGGLMFLTSSKDGAIDLVMKEIDVGECPF